MSLFNEIAFDVKRWPHQESGLNACTEALESGVKSICICSPTGGGKTQIAADLIRWAVNRGLRVAVYTNRKMLTQNLVDQFEEYGVSFGVQAADWEGYGDEFAPVQICSLQTQQARVIRRRNNAISEDKHKFKLPEADLVIRDEAHLRANLEVTDEHKQNGAQYVGFTATPLDITDQFDKLIVAGTKRELFKYDPPALIPAHISAISEMDTEKVKRKKDGEYIINKKLREVWTSHIVGSVREEYLKRCDGMPFMGFGFGVPESKFHANDFCKHGIECAHIDGDNVFVDGKDYKSDPEARRDVMARYKSGELKGLWNRFVLREGINQPHTECLLLACPIGSLLSYIQVVGRLLRYHPGIEKKRILDFGGNWYRHPSPNTDIDWHGCWNIPVRDLSGAREMAIREGTLSPGWSCPQCGECHKRYQDGCRNCGFTTERGTPIRRVVQEDGTLRQVEGFPKKHKPKVVNGSQKLWDRISGLHGKTGRTGRSGSAGHGSVSDIGKIFDASQVGNWRECRRTIWIGTSELRILRWKG